MVLQGLKGQWAQLDLQERQAVKDLLDSLALQDQLDRWERQV